VKTVVAMHEISELDIKPGAEVAQWRRMVSEEIASRWKDRSAWIEVPCPACGSAAARAAFEHMTIKYSECSDCGSLYAPRRPDESAIRGWYRESKSACFWRERLLRASAAAREEKIVQPRADWIGDGISEYVPHAKTLVDLSLHGRPLLEAIAQRAPKLMKLVAAGATADLDGTDSGRIQVRPSHTSPLAIAGPADVIVAVDVLDRASDVRALIASLEGLIAPGGAVFVTCPLASGFEVQSLWERSPTVLPPDKLNLPTVDGLMRLFPAPGWELLELSTPGMFDVETVRRALSAEPQASWPRVLRSLVEHTDAAGRTALVEFLQARRLTSFARMVARRRS
jgi:hypothetical protein